MMEDTQTAGQTGIGGGGPKGLVNGKTFEDRKGNGETSAKAEHSEGPVAKAIEKQTAKLPSDVFLWTAAGVIGASAIAQFTGHKDKSRFFGQWVAPILILGLYNKIVKVQGSDAQTDPR